MSQIGSITSSYGYGNMMGGMSGLSGMGVKQSLAALASEPLSQIDSSGTGSISESEFEQAFAQAASGTSGTSSTSATSSATNATADSIFKKIDTNGDGKISADEWNTFQQKVQAHQGGHGHHHHAQAADDADSSTSSTQSPAQTLQNLVAQLYKTADTNGNGQLSQGELTNWLTSGVVSM
jgi:Ca2+-binding EF-hand superfamily protein